MEAAGIEPAARPLEALLRAYEPHQRACEIDHRALPLRWHRIIATPLTRN